MMKRLFSVLAFGLLCIAGGGVAGWRTALRVLKATPPIVVNTTPESGGSGQKFRATTPVPTNMFGANFITNSAAACAAGTLCQYRDNSNALQIHGTDNTLTQLWPGYSQTTSLGTSNLQLQSDGRLLQFNPNDTYPSFYLNLGTYASGDAEPDTVAKLCWNCGNGGGLVDPAHPASGIAFERHFVAGHPQTETHLTYTDTTGVEHRFLSCEGHEDDNSTSCFFDATNINVGSGINSSGTVALAVNPTNTILWSPSHHQSATLDDSGSGTVTVSSTDGTHTGSLFLSSLNNGSATLQGGLVRLQDANGIVVFENSGSQTDLFDNAHDVQLDLSSSQAEFLVNGGPAVIVQAGQLFVYNRRILNQLDNVGTNTRIDQNASLFVYNSTAATSGAPQQFTGPLVLYGEVWNGSANQPSAWSWQNQPINGSPPVGHMAASYSSDGANASTKLDIDSNGVLSCATYKTTTATVATGGGSSAATFAANSVGGAGQPTTATQSGWLKMLDSTGATIWIPVWK